MVAEFYAAVVVVEFCHVRWRGDSDSLNKAELSEIEFACYIRGS